MSISRDELVFNTLASMVASSFQETRDIAGLTSAILN